MFFIVIFIFSFVNYNLQGPTENRQGEWVPWINIIIIIIIIIIIKLGNDNTKRKPNTCNFKLFKDRISLHVLREKRDEGYTSMSVRSFLLRKKKLKEKNTKPCLLELSFKAWTDYGLAVNYDKESHEKKQNWVEIHRQSDWHIAAEPLSKSEVFFSAIFTVSLGACFTSLTSILTELDLCLLFLYRGQGVGTSVQLSVLITVKFTWSPLVFLKLDCAENTAKAAMSDIWSP